MAEKRAGTDVVESIHAILHDDEAATFHRKSVAKAKACLGDVQRLPSSTTERERFSVDELPDDADLTTLSAQLMPGSTLRWVGKKLQLWIDKRGARSYAWWQFVLAIVLVVALGLIWIA